jgi:hypothetical protein
MSDDGKVVPKRRAEQGSKYEGVVIGPQPDQEGNKLQRPKPGFIHRAPYEAQLLSPLL